MADIEKREKEIVVLRHEIVVLRHEIVVLRDENKGYKKQLQDGTLSRNIAKETSNWISTNDRQIETKEKQIEQKERQITSKTEEQEKRATFDVEITLERIRNPGKSAVHRFA